MYNNKHDNTTNNNWQTTATKANQRLAHTYIQASIPPVVVTVGAVSLTAAAFSTAEPCASYQQLEEQKSRSPTEAVNPVQRLSPLCNRY